MWLARQMQHPGRRVGRLLLSSLRLFSPSASGHRDAAAAPAGPAHFMVDYLVSSCGLSRVDALWASDYFTHLRSSENPDAVLRLLRQAGLGDDQIRITVRKYPRMLLCKPEKTLEPRIKVLKGAGFSGSEVAQLISSIPTLIHYREMPCRLEFWRKLVGTNEDLMKVVKKAPFLFRLSLNGIVIPRLSLFRDLGIPDGMMGRLLLKSPRWILLKSDWIKKHVEQVKVLGFSPNSGMFFQALLSVGALSRRSIDVKSKLLKSFGWTEPDLISAILRFPNILLYSEKKIQNSMSFLLNEAGCEPSYVARRPVLVGYSMEKRLMPRNYVLQCLKKRGLSSRIYDFWAMMQMPDQKFVQKFIVPYRGQLPELPEPYHTLLSSSQAKDNGFMGNSTRRGLHCKFSGPCESTNPIDRCWRCRKNWATNWKQEEGTWLLAGGGHGASMAVFPAKGRFGEIAFSTVAVLEVASSRSRPSSLAIMIAFFCSPSHPRQFNPNPAPPARRL
ncbi:hypothetical protein Taro_018954 [Colocasia esculenta]|uniref:Uncharacterized protein n=1 Tax=Colocasia esculenta TaxID=4460 RepID=A0A843V0N8_COLES|nr:hypothetical protein [Colocasia esculenta]